MRKSNWTTYKTTSYTHSVSQDQASAGGVHLHQVRKAASGWQKRIIQSNGNHASYGETVPLSDAEGEAAYETARSR